MKKILLTSLFPLLLLLSGCSGMNSEIWTSDYWNSYEQSHHEANLQPNQYIAHDGSVRTYQQPRKYHVSEKDIQKYNSINDRIAKRKAEIQQKYANPSIDSSHPAPTQNQRSDTYHSSSSSMGETNY